jgi:hypothetical protein
VAVLGKDCSLLTRRERRWPTEASEHTHAETAAEAKRFSLTLDELEAYLTTEHGRLRARDRLVAGGAVAKGYLQAPPLRLWGRAAPRQRCRQISGVGTRSLPEV